MFIKPPLITNFSIVSWCATLMLPAIATVRVVCVSRTNISETKWYSPMVTITRSSAVADMRRERLCISYSLHCVPLITIDWLDFLTQPFTRGQLLTAYWQYWRPQWGGFPRAIGFLIVMEKLEWLGYNLMKVAWWLTQSFGHSTSTWQTHRQPRHHSKCLANTLSGGKNWMGNCDFRFRVCHQICNWNYTSVRASSDACKWCVL